ncbi:hypothetical protein WISP_142087 [Willisornis vidua]|uniref:Uncharacterized protein n=1 Tax=Willisornis vidua TaxID=1566151 RepID=A0ABQ9CMR7_9PASS|nr:hypothetical protein WISP_142087 [Willisornis vidua]
MAEGDERKTCISSRDVDSEWALLLTVVCDIKNFKDFMTALDWAVKHSNLEMAEMVAKAGVDVNAKSASVCLTLCKFRENDCIPECFTGYNLASTAVE